MAPSCSSRRTPQEPAQGGATRPYPPECDADTADAAQAVNPGGPRDVQAAWHDGGTRVWPGQGVSERASFFASGSGEGRSGMALVVLVPESAQAVCVGEGEEEEEEREQKPVRGACRRLRGRPSGWVLGVFGRVVTVRR